MLSSVQIHFLALKSINRSGATMTMTTFGGLEMSKKRCPIRDDRNRDVQLEMSDVHIRDVRIRDAKLEVPEIEMFD